MSGRSDTRNSSPLFFATRRNAASNTALPVLVERPDTISDGLDGLALFLAAADGLVDGSFGVDPAQRMEQDIECPASSPSITSSFGKPWCRTLPSSAPSVAIRTWRSFLIPSCSRCRFGRKMLGGVFGETAAPWLRKALPTVRHGCAWVPYRRRPRPCRRSRLGYYSLGFSGAGVLRMECRVAHAWKTTIPKTSRAETQ